MSKRRIIGNMTGNSMDAIDLVLTEFDDEKMNDICSFSRPYSADMQQKTEYLRQRVCNKTKEQILQIPEFKQIHDEYITGIAECINEMCQINNIDKTTIDAIGFHGKTLDHNPPSKAAKEHSSPYTLQIGSGKMLADLTQIPVIYDFRSDYLMNGFEGAPLAPPHNARIAATEGSGCYFNGGNTSNFSIVSENKALFGSDCGPFNEYTDNYVRQQKNQPYDKDGIFGSQGNLDVKMLQFLFASGQEYYETPLPKSGDPAYYHKAAIFDYVQQNNIPFADAIRTFEYFAAYIAVYSLSMIPPSITVPSRMILFGGGWKNPVVKQSFAALLNGTAFILPEHQEKFRALSARFSKKCEIKTSDFGDFMEARLFADLAYHKLENKIWPIPEITNSDNKIVCGRIATPSITQRKYDDYLSRVAKTN